MGKGRAVKARRMRARLVKEEPKGSGVTVPVEAGGTRVVGRVDVNALAGLARGSRPEWWRAT